MGGEAVAQGVGGCMFSQTDIASSLLHSALNALRVSVMATSHARAGIDGELLGREDILPAPLPVGIEIFSFKGVGQVNRTVTLLQIFFVQVFYPDQEWL